MTRQEIVQALRCCAKGLGHDDACENCKVGEIQDRREYIEFAAANVIERLTAENVVLQDGEANTIESLRKEIEWKDMVIAIAKRTQAEAEAERDMVIAFAQRMQAEAEAERDALLEQIKARRSCLDCKHFDYCEFDDATVIDCMSCVTKNCPCHQCSNSSHWGWRGAPEAPEEGDKHE